MKTQIIYEDKDLLVVKKPAGLATQTARVGQQDVVSELKNYLAAAGGPAGRTGPPYLGVVHRLDQPVEGLLVFGKHQKAAAALTAQLVGEDGGQTLCKQYYAVFCGKAPSPEGQLVDKIYKAEAGRAEILESGQSAASVQAKTASLHYRILEEAQVQGETISLADIRIETGRFHQIRAQMAHGGMPLLGDIKYGDAVSGAVSRRLGISVTALCAYRLEFLHPGTKEKLQFQIRPGGTAFSYFPLFSTSV